MAYIGMKYLMTEDAKCQIDKLLSIYFLLQYSVISIYFGFTSNSIRFIEYLEGQDN